MDVPCPKCQHLNRPTARFCRECGTELAADRPDLAASTTPSVVEMSPVAPAAAGATAWCGSCGDSNHASSAYCKSCGAPLGIVSDAPADATLVQPIGVVGAKRPAWLAALVAVAVVVLAIGIVSFLVIGGDDPSSSPGDGEGDGALDTDSSLSSPSSLVAGGTDTSIEGAAGVSVDPTTTTPTLAPVTVVVEATTTTVTTTTTTTTTVAVTTPPTVAPTTPTPTTVPGDLGLPGIAMTKPACDGGYVTAVGNAVTPDNYAEEVSASLATHPGSQYLRTDQTCPSLRQDVDGAAIYMTYFGPFASEQEACAARANGPSDAYVRSLSTALPPSHRIQCA